jgi:outer membrane protein TolC
MELAASTAERRATEQRLQLALVAATERMRVAAALLDTLRLRVQPAREQLVGEMLRGYREGRTSYLDLVAEQGGLLETELEIVEAEANLWRARLRLEQLTGTGPLAPKGE